MRRALLFFSLLAACSGGATDPALAPFEEAPAEEPSATNATTTEEPNEPRGAPSLDASAPEDSGSVPDAKAPKPTSHFECKKLGANAYRPYWVQVITASDGSVVTKDWSTTPKGLLGQNAMTTQAECDQTRAAANDAYGVICSRTGLDGWKPTLYTGTLPGRADFGYLGGSSIMTFGDCLAATKNSSAKGVCFWGGSAWYTSPIDKEGLLAGPFATVDACIVQTKL